MTSCIKDIRNAYSKKKFVMYTLILCALVLTYCITSVLFQFRDQTSLNVWSVEFWDVLVYKKMHGFYEYTLQNLRGAPHGVKDGSWLPIIPQIIWNFPIWLFNHNPETSDITGDFCNVWGKLLNIVCFVVLCIYVYKTVMYLTERNTESALIAVILVAGSIEAYESIAFAGQDEVIYMMTLMIALYYRLKGRRLVSLLFEVITATLCNIMLIPLVVLELINYKKFRHFIAGIVMMLLPGVIFELAYRNNALYQSAKLFNSTGIFQYMTTSCPLPSTIGQISIPMVLLVVIMFMAFAHRNDDNKANVILYTMLSMVIMSFLMYLLFYRYFVYVPLLAIYVACTEGSRAMKAFLMLTAGVCRFFSSFTYPHIFSYFYYSPFAKKILPDNGMFIDVTHSNISNLMCVTNPLSVACIILVLYICCSRKKKEYTFIVSDKVILPIYLGSSVLFIMYYMVWLFVLH